MNAIAFQASGAIFVGEDAIARATPQRNNPARASLAGLSVMGIY